jgi:2,4-dienoyl-CoA reductase-like NADH-dependent reductase (Old Yellow Enzyme family)
MTSSPSSGLRRVDGPAVDTALPALPITLPFSQRTALNRFLKAPMTERLCTWNTPDQPITVRGHPTPEYTRLYSHWGNASIGIIVAGNVMLRHDMVEAYGNPILSDPNDTARVDAFRNVTAAAKRHGSLFVAQLSMPGRQGPAALNPHPVSASDIHLKIGWAGNNFAPPRALTVPEIHDIVKQWGTSAKLCYDAGFDGVQVHCAHAYLLAQFLSPTTNKRTDEYGGTFSNRTRIIFEILEEIRRRVPDPEFIICVKLNSVEFQPEGQTPEDCRNLCVALEEAKVDFIDLSGGTFEGRAFHHVKESTRKRESYFIEFADQIRPLLKKTLLYVTGGFRTAAGMVKAISENSCDGIGLGRPLGAEPYLCRDILNGKVTGALESAIPLPKSTQSTGSQLHQVGRGEDLVSDWSDAEEVERWLEADKIEEERKLKLLPVVDSSGYAPIKAVVGLDFAKGVEV